MGAVFPALVGTLHSPNERRCIDEVREWFSATHEAAIHAKPSLHVYVKETPNDIQATIDAVRYSPDLLKDLSQSFSQHCIPHPLPDIDELYLTHVQNDGGDAGLSKAHYDGPFRWLPSSVLIVRVLICLSGDDRYTTTFHTSGKAVRIRTYQYMALDYDRELHSVNVDSHSSASSPRILLKTHFVMCPSGQCSKAWERFVVNSTEFVNRASRALMRYSNDPQSPAEMFVGVLTNVFRYANNAHPVFAMGLFVAMFGLPLWAFTTWYCQNDE